MDRDERSGRGTEGRGRRERRKKGRRDGEVGGQGEKEGEEEKRRMGVENVIEKTLKPDQVCNNMQLERVR